MESNSAIAALGALAQGTRLDAFRLLVRHEPDGLAAGEIARQLDVPQNTMSVHLATLARAGLIHACQSACKRDPLSARKRDPLSGWRNVDVTGFLALRAA